MKTALKLMTSMLLISCGSEPTHQEIDWDKDWEGDEPGCAQFPTSDERFPPLLAAKYLDIHNKKRAEYCLPPLVWDQNLAKVAQNHAQRANEGLPHNDNRDNEYAALIECSGDCPELGENIAWHQPVDYWPYDTVASGWFSEEWDAPGCNQGGSHYTQLVYDTVSAVGCGMYEDPTSRLYIVCNYLGFQYRDPFEEELCYCGGIEWEPAQACGGGLGSDFSGPLMPEPTCSDAGESGPTSFLFEAESVEAVAPFTLESSHDNYRGEGYLQWPFDNPAANEDLIDESASAVLEYPIEIAQSGFYRVEIRGRRDQQGACADAGQRECNGVLMAFDDAELSPKFINVPWGEWMWDGDWHPADAERQRTIVELCAGTHTLRISGRANGVSIDAIRVYLDKTPPPE